MALHGCICSLWMFVAFYAKTCHEGTTLFWHISALSSLSPVHNRINRPKVCQVKIIPLLLWANKSQGSTSTWMWSLQTVKSSGRSSLRAVTWLFDSSHVTMQSRYVKICQDVVKWSLHIFSGLQGPFCMSGISQEKHPSLDYNRFSWMWLAPGVLLGQIS